MCSTHGTKEGDASAEAHGSRNEAELPSLEREDSGSERWGGAAGTWGHFGVPGCRNPLQLPQLQTFWLTNRA